MILISGCTLFYNLLSIQIAEEFLIIDYAYYELLLIAPSNRVNIYSKLKLRINDIIAEIFMHIPNQSAKG